jgi:hypothetical protein
MKYSIINGGSKTALEVLKAYWKKYPSQCSSLNLLDLFHSQKAYKNVFQAIDSKALPQNTNIEKISNKYYLERLIKDTEVLVYFTHDYFENATCKNQLMTTVSELVKHAPSVKKAVFVNLFEFNQTNEPEYFQKSIEAERKIIEELPQARILWSDLTYSNETSFVDFIKRNKSLRYHSKAEQVQKWTNAEKIADALNIIITDEVDSKLNYVKPTDEATFDVLLGHLQCTKGPTFIDLSKDDIITDLFSTAEYRNYIRLIGNKTSLESQLQGYTPISNQTKYKSLTEEIKQ